MPDLGTHTAMLHSSVAALRLFCCTLQVRLGSMHCRKNVSLVTLLILLKKVVLSACSESMRLSPASPVSLSITAAMRTLNCELPPASCHLQDNFYEKADALVGVARDLDHGCSTTYSFDLESFDPPAAADP